MMDLTSDFAGALVLAAGAAFLLMAKRRQFERTNKYGVERFPTFWAKLRARSADHLLRGSSIVFMAVGTLVLASNHIDSWGLIVMFPACVLMLYLLLGT